MKRQILKSLSTLCVSAMALFATSSLVVSCYDDGALWDAVEDVQGDVDELSKTIAEVQAKLEALTSRVDALYTLKFQVTTENELQYSFDGGTTWVSTGIDLAEECACPEVTLVDNGDTVTISVGEQSYTIEKPEVVKFEIVSGKQFFDYDETKSVVISASGIQSVFVAKTPKGWSVEADSKSVSVTAPAESDYSAATSGIVEVWGATEEGKIHVGTLSVVVSTEPVVISMKGDTVVFSINEEPDYGVPYQVFYGASKAENFDADAKSVVDLITSQAEAMWDMNCNWNDEAEIEVPIAELLGEEAVPGTSYIVWAVSPTVERQGWSQIVKASVSDFIKYYYNPTLVTIESVSSWNDIELSVEVLGADEYLAGWFEVSDWNDPEYFNVYEYLSATPGNVGWGGPAGLFQYYTEKWDGSLKDFCSPDYSNSITPGREYFVFVLPMDPLKSIDDYTNADVTTKILTTAPLQAGGSATAELDITADNAVTVGELRPMVKTTGAAMTFYEWLTAAQMALYSDDELLVDYILSESENVRLTDQTEFQAPWTSCEPDTEYTLVLVLVDKDGKYSLKKETLKTDPLPIDDSLEVEIDETKTVVGSFSATLKFNLVGEFSELIIKAEEADYSYTTVESFEKTVAASTYELYGYEYVSVSDLKDNSYELELDPNKSYKIFVMGKTAEGKYSYADLYECKTVLDLTGLVAEGHTVLPVVTPKTPEYKKGYSSNIYYQNSYDDYGYYYYNLEFDIDPNGLGSVYACCVNSSDEGYFEDGWAALSPADKAEKVLTASYPFSRSAYTEKDILEASLSECAYTYDEEWAELSTTTPVVVLVWQNAEGKWCYHEVDYSAEVAKLRADLHQKRAEELIDGNQWTFAWEEMYGAPAALDLGVTKEGTPMFIYDMFSMYPPEEVPAEMKGMYMSYPVGVVEYEIVASDATDGVVNLIGYDMYDDPQIAVLSYKNLAKTTFTATCEMLMIEDVTMTASSKLIPVYDEQGGIGGL